MTKKGIGAKAALTLLPAPEDGGLDLWGADESLLPQREKRLILTQRRQGAEFLEGCFNVFENRDF